jgi:hypothetical protein
MRFVDIDGSSCDRVTDRRDPTFRADLAPRVARTRGP